MVAEHAVAEGRHSRVFKWMTAGWAIPSRVLGGQHERTAKSLLTTAGAVVTRLQTHGHACAGGGRMPSTAGRANRNLELP